MASPPLSKKEVKRREDMLAACLREGFAPKGVANGHGSACEEAARRLGLPSGTLQRDIAARRIKADWSKYVEPEPAAPEPIETAKLNDDRRTERALRDKITRLEAQLRELDRENVSEREVRERILKLAAETPDPPKWLVQDRKGSGVTGVPSTIWSDWHVGENVSAAEMHGSNAFSLAIAETRIRRLVERTVDLCFQHMTSPRYPGIVVNLIGDLVSGGIHPELAETDEDDLFPVILWTVDRLIASLTALADRFGMVFVACAPGNHGRAFDKKPRAKRYAYRNADWLICCLVERHFKAVGDKRVQFSIPPSGDVLYRVFSHRYMATHGDMLGVKGGDGIIGAIGPIMRGEIKMRHSEAQIGRDYDTLVMGHWHQMLWLPRAIVNNTLKGPDEYSRKFLRAPATPPSQALWFTHPKHGITCRWEVLLDDRSVAASDDWVSVRAA